MIKYNNILLPIKQAIDDYSSNRDNTLEYIGITTDFRGNIDTKVYRKKSLNDITSFELPKCIQDFIKKTENENPNMYFFDFSLRTIYGGDNIYSVSFLVKSNNLIDITPDEETYRIMKTFDKKRNPCIQKGYLVNRYGDVLERKIYYTLNSDNKTYTSNKRFELLVDKREQIIDYMLQLFGCQDRVFSENLFDCSINLGYRIFMTGINISESYRCPKLYFVYDCPKDLHIQYERSLLLIEKIGGDESALKIIKDCKTYKLLLKGFACEYKEQPIWRFYFSVPY